jgi:hypothetical protein
MDRRKLLMYFLCVSLAIAAPSLGINLASADPGPGFASYSGTRTKAKLRSTTHAQRVEAAKRAAARRAAAERAAAQRDAVPPPQAEGGTK